MVERAGVLRLRGEPTSFAPIYVPAGGTERTTLMANALFRVVRLVLPASPYGLLWSGWFVGKDEHMSANRPYRHDADAHGISLERTIELDVESAYVRRVQSHYVDDGEAVSRLGRVLRDDIEVRGVTVRISEAWGLTFYNPTPATIYYSGAAAVIRRVLP